MCLIVKGAEEMGYSLISGIQTIPDLEHLVEQYGDSLLRMCFLYLKDIHLAEDAVQDTFIKVHNNYSNFKGNSEEKTWITKIAINVCKNYLRSSWWKHIDESAVLNNIPSGRNEAAQQDDTLLVEIMKLSPKYREVILLYYYQDIKVRDIAKILDTPETTISVRLRRAREKLKKKLKGWYYDE